MAHIPIQWPISQTILEKMHQELLILRVRGHPPIVIPQVSFRTRVSLVLRKLWDFKFWRDPHSLNQSQVGHVETQNILILKGLHALLEHLQLSISFGRLFHIGKPIFKVIFVMLRNRNLNSPSAWWWHQHRFWPLATCG